MGKPVSVRLDDDALRALGRLEATGLTRSEAIRAALLQAAERLRRADAVAAEVRSLEEDQADRLEMLEVAALMERLRAPR
ncbi:MAG: ribbon-helix-helix protein, CopG family [Actinobacteria bacterium]|nr:ribbon-helix-helix protein, CopG family [Actinomycetota bacterium]